MRTINSIEQFKYAAQEYDQIAIYGCGHDGSEVLIKILETGTYDSVCFVVSNEEQRDKRKRLGIDIKLLDELAHETNRTLVVVASTRYWKEMVAILDRYKFDFVICEVKSFICKKPCLDDISQGILQIKRKMAMKDDVWPIKNAWFYVPYYPLDFIMAHIVDTGTYFENDILDDLNQFIPEGAIIADIGANIGNHSVYWGNLESVRKVYSFEPIRETFQILSKNIELNQLAGKVRIFNYGCSDAVEMARPIQYRISNTGDTHLMTDDASGTVKLIRFDSMIDEIEKLDFVKIDVEDYEIHVLQGMREAIKRFKPIIFIESLPNLYPRVKDLLEKQGYALHKVYPHHNYLFMYSE